MSGTLAILLTEYRSGSRIAGEELMKRIQRYARRYYSLRISDTNEVDELVQTASLAFLQNSAKIKDPQRVHAFVHKQLFFVIQEFYRDAKRRKTIPLDDASEAEIFKNQTPQYIAPYRQNEANLSYDSATDIDLVDTLDQVPEVFRNAVIHRYFDDLEFAEIGQRAGISAANARQRVTRGITLMRTILAKKK